MQTANLRATPDRDGHRLAVLDPGHKATITDGPRPWGELTWWQLDHAGWCVESVEGEDIIEVAPSSDWEKAIFFVLQQEGGSTMDENDPGNWTGGSVGVGKLQGTKFGISSLSYPETDILNLTKQEAREIYWKDYWIEAGCDVMTWPLSLAMLDSAVNCGVGQALRFLHESNNDFDAFNQLRREFYLGLHQFQLYGTAWIRRVDDLEAYAKG